MIQNNQLKEFLIIENYPYELKYVFEFAILFFMGCLFLLSFIFLKNVFFELFFAFATFVSFLMAYVVGEKLFSKDEKFLKDKDKENFKSYCKDFPTEYKREILGDLDFERTSLKDIIKINKKIRKINGL